MGVSFKSLWLFFLGTWFASLLLGALLVVGGLVAINNFHLFSDDEKSPSVSSMAVPPAPLPKKKDTKSPPPPEDPGVLVKVKGAPENAKIYVDNTEMPNNPFRVKKSAMLIPIRVEAEGYEPTRLFVEPSEVQVVEVSLNPSTVKQAEIKEASRQVKPKRKVKRQKENKTIKTKSVTSKRVEVVEKPKKKFVKGGRGTEIAQEFE